MPLTSLSPLQTRSAPVSFLLLLRSATLTAPSPALFSPRPGAQALSPYGLLACNSLRLPLHTHTHPSIHSHTAQTHTTHTHPTTHTHTHPHTHHTMHRHHSHTSPPHHTHIHSSIHSPHTHTTHRIDTHHTTHTISIIYIPVSTHHTHTPHTHTPPTIYLYPSIYLSHIHIPPPPCHSHISTHMCTHHLFTHTSHNTHTHTQTQGSVSSWSTDPRAEGGCGVREAVPRPPLLPAALCNSHHCHCHLTLSSLPGPCVGQTCFVPNHRIPGIC